MWVYIGQKGGKMAAIRPLNVIVDKWARVAPQRAEDFRNGVQNPKKDWETQAAAAESAWRDGVTAAANAGLFSAGVRRAGTAKWQSRTLQKGVPRWPEGIRIATDDYRDGFAPYHEEIERTELPPRYARGDPRNLERVAAIASALHQRRMRERGIRGAT